MPNRRISKLDLPIAGMIPGGAASVSTDDITPPALPVPPAPYHLTLTTAAERSAVTPTSSIGAAWYPPDGVAPSSYIVQWATDSVFTTTYTMAVAVEQATITGLPPATVYYVRVAAIVGGAQGSWSDSSSITTASDTVQPAAPSSPAAAFNAAGDLIVTWANPTSANFRDVEIVIRDTAGGTIYATVYDATQRYVWTAAANLAATSGAGDPTLYVALRGRGWNGLFSAATVTASATKARPGNPSGTSADFTGRDAIFACAAQADAIGYRWTIDTVAQKDQSSPGYVYGYDKNRADHSGTADPSLSWSLVAVDGLGQISATPATGTATNAAPGAPTLTLTGGFAILVCQVTSAQAADFAAYEYVWKRDGTTVRTLESSAAEQQYEVGSDADAGVHSWTCTVRQKDAFGQYSTATASGAVVLDAITIGSLRSGAVYRDDLGTAAATLDALKDAETASGGITYGA